MILYLNCSDKNNQEKDKAMDYKLTWGMISNYLEGTSSSRAAFTIHNNSNKILGNKAVSYTHLTLPTIYSV